MFPRIRSAATLETFLFRPVGPKPTVLTDSSLLSTPRQFRIQEAQQRVNTQLQNGALHFLRRNFLARLTYDLRKAKGWVSVDHPPTCLVFQGRTGACWRLSFL